jgi:uncharacterized protein (DUF697 family)
MKTRLLRWHPFCSQAKAALLQTKTEVHMHDIDRTLGEINLEEEGLESEPFAFEEEDEFTDSSVLESPLDESDEIDLAANLMEIVEEGDLDQFLGNLMRRAGRAAGKFVRSSTGRALGGILKAAAKQAVPVVGKALGGFVGGPAGAALGGTLASRAAQHFGLEVDGMSEEDQDFEMARRFVRFGAAAAAKAASAPANADPNAVAKSAVASAARRHAPGLVGAMTGKAGIGGSTRTGRWIRRGRKIILFGVY